MYISQAVPKKNIAFGKIDKDYKNSDIKTRNGIRESMEKQWDSSYEYSYQMGRMNLAQSKLKVNTNNYKTISDEYEKHREKSIKEESIVDFGLLKRHKIQSLNEREHNRLYTGARLTMNPDAVKGLKEAGIKSVLCLAHEESYAQNVRETGLKYADLRKIGNEKLGVFNFHAIEMLTKNPELYAEDSSLEIEDLKTFTDIVNGRSQEFPPPIYMGCQYGTNRTYEWYTISKVLKDQPKDQPLTSDRVVALSKLLESIYEDR